MNKLKTCPFCDGEAEVIRSTRSMCFEEYRVWCRKCGAMVKNFSNPLWKVSYFDTEEEATEAWNRREGSEDYTKADVDTAYQRGMYNAWAASLKIVMQYDSSMRGVNTDSFDEAFEMKTLVHRFSQYAPQEAIDRIAKYEKQKDEIHLWDELEDIDTGLRFIVTRINEGIVEGICPDGAAYDDICLNDVHKTGRSFPELADVLKRMEKE